MYNKSPLPLSFQFFREKRQRRWGIGLIGGHGEQFGRLIKDDNGIVLVKHAQLPPILLAQTTTDGAGWKFFHR